MRLGIPIDTIQTPEDWRISKTWRTPQVRLIAKRLGLA